MTKITDVKQSTEKYSFNLWTVFFVYVIVNVALIFFVDPGISLAKGADAGSWYRPALALLKHGSFVMLDSPDTLMTYRAPLYPLYEAIMLWISDGKTISIIVGQVVLLWITGVFASGIVGFFIPQYRIIALVLIVFNPNAIAIAHLIQSDTLYALFIVVSIWSLFKYMLSDNKIKWSVITSIFLGLSCLVRPTGQYLIFLMPIAFPLINILYGKKNILFTSVRDGVFGIIVAGLILFPWMSHNNEAGWGYVMVTDQIKTVYLRDNTVWAEAKDRNFSINDAKNSILDGEKEFIKSIDDWEEGMSDQQKYKMLVAYYTNKFTSYPITTLLAGYVDSWIDFIGGGGSVNLHNLFSIDAVKALEKHKTKSYSSRIEGVFDSLSDAPIKATMISILSYIYIIALRVLGVFGILEMIRRKEHSLLLIILGLILYFALAALFVGNSRYRLPIEIGFVMLSLYGLSFLKSVKKLKK